MIAVDTNILVYAHRNDSPFHERARSALDSLANGTRAWAVPWPCAHLQHLGPLALGAKVQGGAVHDARIAAICLAHGVAELWSADRDFARIASGSATINDSADATVASWHQLHSARLSRPRSFPPAANNAAVVE